MSYWYDQLGGGGGVVPSVLKFLIKSSFLWSSHQIHFKFATLIHCIIPINVWMISSWYIFLFSVFLGVFFQCFYFKKFSLRKNVKVSDEVKFSMKFSSDSLQICYIDSLYHTHQCVNDFKLIFFLIFCIFRCFFSVFTLKNLAWEKMLMFLIKSSFLWSSHHSLQICYIDSLCHTHQYVNDFKLIFLLFSAFLGVFSVFLLRKM